MKRGMCCPVCGTLITIIRKQICPECSVTIIINEKEINLEIAAEIKIQTFAHK